MEGRAIEDQVLVDVIGQDQDARPGGEHVTEVTAMTWLPRLISAIRSRYPRVIIEPYVEAGVMLRDKLLADEIDLMIVPDVVGDQRFVSRRIGVVTNAWRCKPGFVGKRRRLSADALASHRLLIQDDRSGTGLLYNRWFRTIGVQPDNTLSSNSLVALIGLTVSGMGISYLPRTCLAPMIDSGALEVLQVTPALPQAGYAAVYRNDQRSKLVIAVATLAQAQCDFGLISQTAPDGAT